MDNIPDNIAILIYKLNCLKSVLEYDFFSRDKTNTSGEIINAIQYKIPDQKPKGITYSIKKNKHPITTINHTLIYTLVGFNPQTMGRVLHPNF